MPLLAPTLGWCLLFFLCACGQGVESSSLGPAQRAGMDPFVLERIDAARAACARGEAGAWLELAKTLDANGLREEALEVYARCLTEADASSGARASLEYLRGQALATLGRSDAALAAFDAALAAGDRYAPTHWRRGELLLESGRLAEARAAFEAALALEPHALPAHLGLARLALLADDPRAAVARLAPLAEQSNDERFVHGLLARAYRALGDESAAARELAREERAKRIALADPRSAEVATRAAGVLSAIDAANEFLLRGQPERAAQVLAPLYARRPDDLTLAQMYGKALTEARELERAIQVLEEALLAYPEHFKLELFLGLALEAKKAFRKAHEHLLRARTLNPSFGATHAALGEVETKLGLFSVAEASLVRALETGEDTLRTRLLLAEVRFQQQAFARALAGAEEACSAYPNAAAAWSCLAEARIHAGQLAAARQALAEAEERNPDYERLEGVRALLAAQAQESTAPR